jgi:hypothetical protein
MNGKIQDALLPLTATGFDSAVANVFTADHKQLSKFVLNLIFFKH